MAKDYQTPKLEKTTTAVMMTEETTVDTPVVIGNQAAKIIPNDLTGIYTGQIDNFKLFMDGQYASNNLEERGEAQITFMSMVNNILNAEYPVMSACMDYFIKTIQENPSSFTYEKLSAPYWAMKKRPNEQIAKPYLTFIEFIVSYSANVQRKNDFLKGYDTTTFFSYWNEKQAKNLYRYLFD